MKHRLGRTGAAIAVLALGMSGAFAHDVGNELGHAIVGPQARVIVLGGSVRHDNVAKNESVTFVVPHAELTGWDLETQSPPANDQFSWNFDVRESRSFLLAEIAPSRFDAGPVEVHVMADTR
jgi:hypothetical protein